MEVVAVSRSKPTFHDVNGIKLYTSIIYDPLTRPSDYIELDESGILYNETAAHDGPVYATFAENYDHWCHELGLDRSSWDWCHWGENITLRSTGKAALKDEIHLGDIWKIGEAVRLEGCYLRVLRGGRIHPGDEVSYERFSGDPIDIATITRVAFDASLKTRDTMSLLADHKFLLGMNKWTVRRKLIMMDGRDFRPYRIVDEGGGVKSFYLRPVDGEPLGNYLPGQFLTARIPPGKTRSWSISDWLTRDNPSCYRLSIKKAGEASTWMHEASGRFFLDWTSFLPMRQSHDVHPNFESTPVLWIHVALNSDHFPFRDEIPQFQGRSFKKVIFFTKPSPSDVQGVHTTITGGRPDEQTLESIIGAPFHLEPFEESARRCLQKLRFQAPFDSQRIFRSVWGGVGACGSCATKLLCGSVSGGIQVDGSVLACSAIPASDIVEVYM
ncbi:pyruvate kinase-like protein [Biscogniauxia sp. FL1348]|nr:pyruvate kinase-like protein [Biscogniauxia sp. FL1348]